MDGVIWSKFSHKHATKNAPDQVREYMAGRLSREGYEEVE
jgi:hypothetical protein